MIVPFSYRELIDLRSCILFVFHKIRKEGLPTPRCLLTPRNLRSAIQSAKPDSSSVALDRLKAISASL